jgi:hypothetical protein
VVTIALVRLLSERISQDLTAIVLSVVGDVPVDSAAFVVTSSILRGFAGTVFEDAPKGRVYVRVLIGMSACAL